MDRERERSGGRGVCSVMLFGSSVCLPVIVWWANVYACGLCVCVCVCAQLSVFVSLYPRPLDFSCAICSSPLKPDSVFQLLFYSSQNSWSFVFKECFMFYLLLLFFFLFCLTHRLKPLCYKYEVGIAVCIYHPHQQHFIPVGIMIINDNNSYAKASVLSLGHYGFRGGASLQIENA